MSHYGTIAGLYDYIESRGGEIPDTADDDMIEAALTIASEWIDNTYTNSFSGYKTGGYTQEREWPRTNAIANTYPQYNFSISDIPDRVVNATYEAAFRQIKTPGSLQKDYTPNKYKSISADGISVTYNEFDSASDIQGQFTIISQLLAPLLDKKSGAGFATFSGEKVRV